MMCSSHTSIMSLIVRPNCQKLSIANRALREGNPRYKIVRTISDIMLVWELHHFY